MRTFQRLFSFNVQQHLFSMEIYAILFAIMKGLQKLAVYTRLILNLIGLIIIVGDLSTENFGFMEVKFRFIIGLIGGKFRVIR